MTDTADRLYGPAQPSTSNATLYTSTSAVTVIRNIHIMNTTASEATINIGVDATSATAANCFLFTLPVPANSTYDWSGFLVLESDDTLTGLQGTSSALTVTVSGVVIT